MAPTFHLFLPQMRMTHEAIVERALAAEAAGFEGISFMDHLAPPMALDQDMWEAMTHRGLGARPHLDAQGRPPRPLRLLPPPGGAGPAGDVARPRLARPVRARDRLGLGARRARGLRGRLHGGPGAGRVGWPRPWRSCEVCGPARSSTTTATHFTLEGAQQLPTPTAPIPITIGGVGKRTLALVREHAEWWNLPIHELERLDELRGQVGDARVSVQAMVALVPDEPSRDDVTALARRRFGRGAMGRNLAIGTADELVEHFGALADRGVERFHVWFADFAPVETLERFAAVVAEVIAADR